MEKGANGMIVRNENQALCVAVEMERRAIGIYERALLLAQDEGVRKGIRDILSDEQFVSGEYTTDFMLDFEKKHKDGKK